MVRIGGLIPLISYTRRNFASPVQFWVGLPPPVLSQSLTQLFLFLVKCGASELLLQE